MSRRVALVGVGLGAVIVFVSAILLASLFSLALTGFAIAVVALAGVGFHTVNHVREWRGLPRNDLFYLWGTLTLTSVAVMGVVVALRRL